MANPMNTFDLEYYAAAQDDNWPDARDGVSSHLQSSLSSHDPSLMGYPNSFSDTIPKTLTRPFSPSIRLQELRET